MQINQNMDLLIGNLTQLIPRLTINVIHHPQAPMIQRKGSILADQSVKKRWTGSQRSPLTLPPHLLQKFRRRFQELLSREILRLLSKLMLWVPEAFAVTFRNICRHFSKLLPWLFETFAASFRNFCREFQKLLPWVSETFAMSFRNFCCEFQKLLPWVKIWFAAK